jgi:hypothetical protein
MEHNSVMSYTAVEALSVAVGIAAAVAIVALHSTLADVFGIVVVVAAGIAFAWAITRSESETGEPPSPDTEA